MALRRRHARRRAQREFPRWPIEDVLVRHQEESFRDAIRANGGERVPFVNFWPGGHRFAYILTHDVEGPAGIENIERVRKVERVHGVVSSWNFVAEDYPIPPGLFEKLRADGCEIGLHGIHHDHRLWRNEETFVRTLPKIHHYLAEWQAVGWRSPVTYRKADWMPRLGVLYDSSFPDTDPFEPQAGGCCSILPYFIDDMVELPITLVQDHTMWELLQQPGIDLWIDKSEWIREHHGLINADVHPDYLIRQDRLDQYDEFLGGLTTLAGGWHALPRDVASWWKDRERLQGDAEGATVAHAREVDGRIVYDV
jgi:peptidoglycan/xylan/chitin deacetylase (PgdA/CDA1 family)